MGFENPQTESHTPELGAFCLIMGALTLKVMDSMRGNLFNIDKYIADRDWKFLKVSDETFTHYLRYFRIIIGALICMCPVSLFVWAGTIFYISDEDAMITPVAILMVGLFVIFFALGIFYIRWKGYTPSILSSIYIILAGCCFLIYEICANFLNVDDKSFFGISAVFLSYNCIIFMFVIFVNCGRQALNFLDVLNNKLPENSEDQTIDEKDDFSKVLSQQSNSKTYKVSQYEVDQYFTIPFEEANLLRGGIIREFGQLEPVTQVIFTLVLYVVSVGILVGYAFIVYNNTDEYKLGFITLIAVVTTDSIIYCFYYAGMSQSVLQLCFLSIIFRGWNKNKNDKGYILSDDFFNLEIKKKYEEIYFDEFNCNRIQLKNKMKLQIISEVNQLIHKILLEKNKQKGYTILFAIKLVEVYQTLHS